MIALLYIRVRRWWSVFQEPLLLLWCPPCKIGVAVPRFDVVAVRVLERRSIVVPHVVRILGEVRSVAPKA